MQVKALFVKAAIIHTVTLTLDQMTTCNVRRVICSDTPTRSYHPAPLQLPSVPQSVFRLIVRVLRFAILMLRFDLTVLNSVVWRKLFKDKKRGKKDSLHATCQADKHSCVFSFLSVGYLQRSWLRPKQS